jgi:hypothetical protein
VLSPLLIFKIVSLCLLKLCALVCNCLSNTDLAGKFMLQTDKELMQLGFIAKGG